MAEVDTHAIEPGVMGLDAVQKLISITQLGRAPSHLSQSTDSGNHLIFQLGGILNTLAPAGVRPSSVPPSTP